MVRALGARGTSAGRGATLEQQVLAVLRSPEISAQLAVSGVSGPKGARELQTLLDTEFKRWPVLIPKLGIKTE
jgi:hypothetical protein